jgi:hypothetical protein
MSEVTDEERAEWAKQIPVLAVLGETCFRREVCKSPPCSCAEDVLKATKPKASELEVLCACADSCAKDAEIERLRAALNPFGYFYQLNDCQDKKPDDALEVPISDLRRAFELVGGEFPYQQNGDGK